MSKCDHWDFEACALRAQEKFAGQETPCPYCERDALAARLAEADAHIEDLCGLVEYWAPKDGVQRTYDARAFLAADSASLNMEPCPDGSRVLCVADQPEAAVK